MKYIETAFGQLAFAMKLMQAAEDGAIDVETIDRSLTATMMGTPQQNAGR